MSQRLFREWCFWQQGPFLEACPVPCTASLPEAATQKTCSRSLPYSHPSTYSLSSSSNWVCPSPGAPGRDREFSSWEDWSYIHSQAGERCCDTWLLLQGLWVNRRPDFQEWMKWRNMEPVPTASNLKTARKSSRNISVRQVLWSLVETSNSQVSLGKFEAVFLFFFFLTLPTFVPAKQKALPTPTSPQTSHLCLFVKRIWAIGCL